VRGRPILDVGVGAGRTASFLRLLSDDYVAVDYTPAMVEAFRRNHPDLEVHLGDARDLSRFASGRFGLAVFSFNGIDAVSHDDRARVLAELHRVLAPGGWLVCSTHNLEGPGARERPWRAKRAGGQVWWRALRWTVRLPQRLPGTWRSWRNWWGNRSLEEQGEGWAMRRAGAHEFGVVLHYATADAVRREVCDAGFDEPVLLAREDGRELDGRASLTEVQWFQVVARKPA